MKPDGSKLLAKLIELLAEQEGVTVDFFIENERGEKICRSTHERIYKAKDSAG